MFSKTAAIFYFALFVAKTKGLVELPQVDENSILSTEAAIRSTMNTLFYSLKLGDIRSRPRLKEYSTVYNCLISFTLQDYNNLKEIAKLTKVDNKKINNETLNFMTAINELLNEDIDVQRNDFPDVDDESVAEYVHQFLSRLDKLKKEFDVDSEHYHIKEDLYQILKDDDVQLYNGTMNIETGLFDYGDNDTLLMESEFWKPHQSSRRIYNGDRIKIKYFPFMSSIQIFNKFHCGGSIIKNDLVITAASCLQLAWNNRFFRENPAFLSVRVGSNFYHGGGENIPVLEVFFHPEYNPRNLWNNLCLLRLVRKLNFRKRARKIKKIDFDRRESSLPLTTEGITIIGWGARGASNIVKSPWENRLAYSILDVYPVRECQDIYSKEYVTKKHFCAGFFSRGGGACNHDVGGPGIVNGILMGVISFGSPICGTPDAPTVFTKLGYYVDWIESIMEQEVHSHRLRTTERMKFDYPTLGRHYTSGLTTFKIGPISGKLQPIPVTDILRTMANEKLFKDFLSALFRDKKLVNNAATLETIAKMSGVATEPPSVAQAPLPIEIVTEAAALVTDIGNVDPDIKHDNQETENEDDTVHQVPLLSVLDFDKPSKEPTIIKNEDLHTIDKNLEELEKIDKKIDKLVNVDKSMEYTPNEQKEVTRFQSSKNFERDLVNLIDDIDLKEILDSVSSVEEGKLALNEKVIKLFNEKEIREKMSEIDDSVLTLLYLSDNENRTSKRDELGLIQEYINENDDKNDGDDYNEGEGGTEGQGLSIEPNQFKDLTYRNGINYSNVINMLTKEEIRNILENNK